MLKGNKVKLGPVTRENIESFLKWFNDPEITHYLVMYRPITRMEEEDWLENLKSREDNIHFSIVILSEDDSEKLIGNCGLHKIDWKNRVANVGIVIGEKEYQNKGLGTEAMKLLVQYGFITLNLNRIQLEVHKFNVRALMSYKKVGFKEEGVRRQAIYVNGEYHDSVIMGILKDEWEKLKSES